MVLGVRPEHLAAADPGTTALLAKGDGDDEGLAATVTGIEWLGHEQHVVASVAGTPVTARQPVGGPPVELGATIRLQIRPGGLHLFDADTTERISGTG